MKRFLPLSLVLALGAVPALAGAPPAVGPDFQVNVESNNSQFSPDVAQDTAGDFVVVWVDQSQPSQDQIKARLFTASGAPKTGEINVAIGDSPRVAMTPLGDFVVAWEFMGQIYTRHFDRRGQTPLIPFDPLPSGARHSPDVAVDPTGNVYVVWAETTFASSTIMLQRYGPSFPASPPEQVSQPGAPYTRNTPRIAVDPSGSLLVSWDDFREEGGHHIDVWARRWSGTWGPEVRVNASTIGDQEGSAPILYADGTGAVVYNDLKILQIMARRIDAAGNPTGDPVSLGDTDGAIFFAPGAAAGPDGTALVAWLKNDLFVHGRFFDRSWSPLGDELRLSSYDADLELDPAVSAGGLGSFAAVWSSGGYPPPIFPFPTPPGRDGSGSGIFGRAFSSLTCAADSEVLCLQNGRFQARVSWKNPFTGETGTGKTLPLTDDTGSFWFFDPANQELMLKVLDARLVNGYFWVFFGSLSNVEYTVTVTDTATGATKTYHNPPLQFGSQSDVAAFKDPPGTAPFLAAESAPLKLKETATAAAVPSLPCTPDATGFCALNRFRVEVSFVDPRSASTGQGRATQLTDDTGVFWFFDASNLELMVKVLDANGVNGHFWVFYGALSDVEYTITVTDTTTGAQKTYHNPLHHLASAADFDAFPAGE